MPKHIEETDKRFLDKTKIILEELPGYVQEYTNEKFAYGTKPSTLYGYVVDLRGFFQYFAPVLGKTITEITVEDLASIRRKDHIAYIAAMRSAGNKDQAIRRLQSSVTSLYEFLTNSDDYSMEANIPKSIPRPKLARASKKIDVFSDSDLIAISESLKNGPNEKIHRKKHSEENSERDNLVITLLLTTGIRVAELIGINLEDFRKDYTQIEIIRKERTPQTIYLPQETVDAVKAYLSGERKKLLKKAEKIAPEMLQDCYSPLLLTLRKGYAGRISIGAVERLIKTHSENATDAVKRSCHELRRTYGSRMLDASGNDLALTSELLGHASTDVTRRAYARTTERRMEAATGLVGFPEKQD